MELVKEITAEEMMEELLKGFYFSTYKGVIEINVSAPILYHKKGRQKEVIGIEEIDKIIKHSKKTGKPIKKAA